MMNIGIDITYNPHGGTKTQIENMVSQFSKLENIEITIFLTKSNKEIIDGIQNNNIKIKKCFLPNLSLPIRILWQQLILPFHLIINRIDVLFCPGNISPIISSAKTVQWIGTIGPFFKEFYEHFNYLNKIKLYLNKIFMISSAYFANAVIFESKFTRELFVNKYKIKRHRSHVINIGNDKFYSKALSHKDKKSYNIYSKYFPYILCVSHLYPYKNIPRMLRAYRIAMENTGVKLNLLIAGSRDYKNYDNQILETINKLSLKNFVHLLGSVTKSELRFLYSNCDFMIFPSPFENFAYTLVEAMCCDTPILSSNTTAMPETCGDAAIYFDPYDKEEMAEKISIFLLDENLKKDLSKKSNFRANELPDYEQVTLTTLEIMNSVFKNDKLGNDF